MSAVGLRPLQENGPVPLALRLNALDDGELAQSLLKAARTGFVRFYDAGMAETLAVYRASVLFEAITGMEDMARSARLFGIERAVFEAALEAGQYEAMIGDAHPFSEACAAMMEALSNDCRR